MMSCDTLISTIYCHVRMSILMHSIVCLVILKVLCYILDRVPPGIGPEYLHVPNALR